MEESPINAVKSCFKVFVRKNIKEYVHLVKEENFLTRTTVPTGCWSMEGGGWGTTLPLLI